MKRNPMFALLSTGLAAAFTALAAFTVPLCAQDPAVSPDAFPTPSPEQSVYSSGSTTPAKPRPTAAPNSLADSVRRSQEARPPEKKKSLGTITNDSLKGSGAAAPSKKGTLNVAPGTKSSGGAVAAAPSSAEPTDNKGRTEADWRRMAAAARTRAAKAESEVKRLEAESKRLENDFYAWDDGNYRDRVIKPAWNQSLEDLRKARLEIDQSRTALDDLVEEARKSNAYPGWLREGPSGSRASSARPTPTSASVPATDDQAP